MPVATIAVILRSMPQARASYVLVVAAAIGVGALANALGCGTSSVDASDAGDDSASAPPKEAGAHPPNDADDDDDDNLDAGASDSTPSNDTAWLGAGTCNKLIAHGAFIEAPASGGRSAAPFDELVRRLYVEAFGDA